MLGARRSLIAGKIKKGITAQTITKFKTIGFLMGTQKLHKRKLLWGRYI